MHHSEFILRHSSFPHFVFPLDWNFVQISCFPLCTSPSSTLTDTSRNYTYSFNHKKFPVNLEVSWLSLSSISIASKWTSLIQWTTIRLPNLKYSLRLSCNLPPHPLHFTTRISYTLTFLILSLALYLLQFTVLDLFP